MSVATQPNSPHENWVVQNNMQITVIQTHVISDGGDDVLFLSFKEGKQYLFVEALEAVVNQRLHFSCDCRI